MYIALNHLLITEKRFGNSPEINTESKFGINPVTEFDKKHSDSVKLKRYSYSLTCELYEFVKKLIELMANLEIVFKLSKLFSSFKL